ncbi:MAG: hypothetical protein VYB46_08540 [Pseudomonadota bacterium]|nr:hypothetical protein [Pseudomonadota bacterium]
MWTGAIIYWLILSALVATYAAVKKDRNWFLAFAVSLALSPLVGFIIYLVTDKAEGGNGFMWDSEAISDPFKRR